MNTTFFPTPSAEKEEAWPTGEIALTIEVH